jgi:ABC-type nitrate/sulfonate/bicarbonate transport system substrate-binding protein
MQQSATVGPVVTVVGSFTPSVVLDLARSTGALDDVGLAVDEVPVTSSPGQFRSLLADELHVGLTSPDNVLAYRFSPTNPLGSRLDVRIVSAVDRGMGLGLYGRPGATADALRGARVGVDVPVSGFALALYALASGLGFSRSDYSLEALGSTPQRLQALLAGECDATMLNAGNELVAEEAGCVRLASASETLSPYLGTVVAVAGPAHLAEARALGTALTSVGDRILDGSLSEEAAESAARRLGLSDSLAVRYVERLREPADGLVRGGTIDRAALQNLVDLRTTWLPEVVDGRDVMADALAEDSGLVDSA